MSEHAHIDIHHCCESLSVQLDSSPDLRNPFR
jgi:hypothetical protein